MFNKDRDGSNFSFISPLAHFSIHLLSLITVVVAICPSQGKKKLSHCFPQAMALEMSSKTVIISLLSGSQQSNSQLS